MIRSAPLRRGALTLLAGLLVGLIAACSSGSPTPAGGGARATVENGNVEVTADDTRFDVGTIEAPAGEAFTITLVNAEDVAHNLSVYLSEGGERIVQGEVITGPDATTQVQVPAQEAGEYYFVCDLHPADMTGTIVVE